MTRFERKNFIINLVKLDIIKLLLKDLFKLNNKTYSNEYHIQKAIDWICYAQKCNNDYGISLGYSLLSGWKASYPETSGYIIPTLLDYYSLTNNRKYLEISEKIADWLCSIQLKNGGFQAGTVNNKNNFPSIFNTGQILFGLIRAYESFNKQKYIDTAIRAGDFLLKNQQKNGNWLKFCYQNKSNTYNVRSAWALLELQLLTDDNRYREAAIKNLKWAFKQSNENFWFKGNNFLKNRNPFLHFICYTIEGFLESGLILKDNSLIEVAYNSSFKLLNYYKRKDFLPATFDENWISKDSYTCLTGIAQLTFIWLKLYTLYNYEKFLINAIKVNNYLKSTQVLNTHLKNIDGAIKGSDPIWGYYMRFTFPNWAAKFFCDSLMLENQILKKKKD